MPKTSRSGHTSSCVLVALLVGVFALAEAVVLEAQARRIEPAEVRCPSVLGVGVDTDVDAGRGRGTRDAKPMIHSAKS